MKYSRTLWIAALIAFVNMLGYGIVFPLIYAYSKKYGLNDFQNGLLFALFSVCQFIATPLIGRLSDKYGRRPMLLVSLLGTALSFLIMAFAPNALFLFLARALDGLTAGNIPVIFAVVSDSSNPSERPKSFGFIGAAFNFGFIFGPAIAAFTVSLGSAAPFITAAVISAVAVLLTMFYLPETNKHMGEANRGALFDFPRLWHTLFQPEIGITFLISLVFYLAFSCAIIYGFQPFTAKVLRITVSQNAMIFTLFGIIGFLSQTYFVQKFSEWLGMKKSFTTALAGTAISFVLMFFSRSIPVFIAGSVILGVFNSTVQTLIPTILSELADAKSQGSIMGLNASYQSLGMIAGPILGGMVATITTPLPFLVGSVFVVLCYVLSLRILRNSMKEESAF